PVRDAVGLVGAGKAATADAEEQPSVADVVDGRGLFGKPQRLAQRQDLKPRADLDVFGTRGNRARDGHWHRAHLALGSHMDLRQPDSVETPALGGVDLFKGSGKCLGLSLPRASLKLVKHAEFETH